MRPSGGTTVWLDAVGLTATQPWLNVRLQTPLASRLAASIASPSPESCSVDHSGWR